MIKRSGDPLVWHTAALALPVFGGDRHALLAWLFEQLIDRLCDLDRERNLANHGIGLGEGWETDRVAVLAELYTTNPPAPLRLLARPIDRQTAAMPYLDIGEGDLVSDQHIREAMPFFFD